MHRSIESQILDKIKKAKRGTVFFTDSFAAIGNAKAVNKALERLVKSNDLQRIATGIYALPAMDKYLGVVLPGTDEIAHAIAKRDKARIVPTGSYAMYKLGLTTQVPLNVVYYTDGSARNINIGNQTITFKKASAKQVSAIGEISKLVIQALRSIGKDQVKEEDIKKIRKLLKNEKSYHLQHDLKIAPEWIRRRIGPLKSSASNE